MRQMGLDYDLVARLKKHFMKLDIVLKILKQKSKNSNQKNGKIENIIGDVEEQRIERPTKDQEKSYSGKRSYKEKSNYYRRKNRRDY